MCDVAAVRRYDKVIGWDRDYFDDMNWMALALLYANSQGPANPSYVATAEALFDKVCPRCAHGFPGEGWRACIRVCSSEAWTLQHATSGDYPLVHIAAQIMAAWDTSCCGALKGGVWWDTQHTQKATASNFGPVITALQLYALTGNATYLAFGQQVCVWVGWGM